MLRIQNEAYFAYFNEKNTSNIIWSSHMLDPPYPCSILVGSNFTQILFHNEEIIPNPFRRYQSIQTMYFLHVFVRFEVFKTIIYALCCEKELINFIKPINKRIPIANLSGWPGLPCKEREAPRTVYISF